MKNRFVHSMLWGAGAGYALFVGAYVVYALWFTSTNTTLTIDKWQIEEAHVGLGGWFRTTNTMPVGGGLNFVNFGYHSTVLRETVFLTMVVLLLDIPVLMFSVVKFFRSFVGSKVADRAAVDEAFKTSESKSPM